MNDPTRPDYVVLALIALSVLKVQLLTIQAAPGTLDPSFAGSGRARVGFGGGTQSCYAAAVQGDGKLVLAGEGDTSTGPYNPGSPWSEFEIVRFDTNNVLDVSFGAGGAVFTPFVNPFWAGGSQASARAVKIQTDGKIVAAGFSTGLTYGDFALARYNPDGSLDSTFGTAGRVITDLGLDSGISSLMIQPDGKIIVAGYAGTNFALARYQTNGVLDATFGSGGIVNTDVGGGSPSLRQGAGGLWLAADGSCLAAGTGLGGHDFAVLRYTANGVLDTTFGSSGKVFTPIPGYGSAYANAIGYQLGNNTILNPDKIVVAGEIYNSQSDQLGAAIRYNLNGTLDTTFGTGGILTTTFGAGRNLAGATAVVVQGQLNQPRKITLTGYAADGTTSYFAMARFLATGAPDTTFGGGSGQVRLSFGLDKTDYGSTLTFQGGRIVIAGSSWVFNHHIDFAAARFNPDGSLDTTFGSSGVVTADFAGYAQAQSVAIQSDGKVVAAGTTFGTPSQFALARCNPDGSLDGTFGAQGRVITDFGYDSVGSALGIEPDGSLVLAGQSGGSFALTRYLTNGVLDSSFGSGGTAITAIGGIYDTANALAVQPDGKIVVTGTAQTAAGVDNLAIARYTTNGVLDTLFAGGGKFIATLGGGESGAQAVKLQSDGKIVVAGYVQANSTTNFAVVRLNPDGSPDNTFGSSGWVYTDFGATNMATAYGLALQPDGRIVVVGGVWIGNYTAEYIALARYLTNGVLDATFGTGGKATERLGSYYDEAGSVALQLDGKIVVAGRSWQGIKYDWAVVRYNPDGSPDNMYGNGTSLYLNYNLVNFEDGSDVGASLALDQIGRPVVAGYASGMFGIARLASEPFLKITSLSRQVGGQVMLQGFGLPNGIHTIAGSTNLSGGSYRALGSVTADAAGFWQYQDTNAVGLDSQFYRLSSP